MKKTYIIPTARVIMMKSRTQIMAGSVTGESVYSTTVSGEGLGRENDGDWDDK